MAATSAAIQWYEGQNRFLCFPAFCYSVHFVSQVIKVLYINRSPTVYVTSFNNQLTVKLKQECVNDLKILI